MLSPHERLSRPPWPITAVYFGIRPLCFISIAGELLHLITLTSSFYFVPHLSFYATGAPPPSRNRAGRHPPCFIAADRIPIVSSAFNHQ
jgi:hypothetical protein